MASFAAFGKVRHNLRIKSWLGCMSQGGEGEVPWYFHTYVGSGHFFGCKILNFVIFGGFQKNAYFWGMKILWTFFWVHHKIGLYSGVISMHFRFFFLKVKVQNGEYFLGVGKFSNIFWGARNAWYFLGVNGRCWAWAYVCRKNESTPPPPGCM